MNENETPVAQTPFVRRPHKTFFHPNGKGTGSALKLELHPAHDDTEGSVFLTIAPQRSVGMRTGPETVLPTFDWKGSTCVKLDLSDLSQILQVFRGIQESVGDGKGLFHRSSTATAVIRFEHRIDPVPGYLLDVSRKPNDGEVQRVGFFFRPAEAFVCSVALEHALMYMMFGIPMVIPRMSQRTVPAAEALSGTCPSIVAVA